MILECQASHECSRLSLDSALSMFYPQIERGFAAHKDGRRAAGAIRLWDWPIGSARIQALCMAMGPKIGYPGGRGR